MDLFDVFAVAVSMSIDAMVVGSTDGLKEPSIPTWKAFCIGAMFGFFQFGMPVIGYFIAFSFQDVLSRYVPWIAFGLLTLLGVKSLIDFIKERKAKDDEAELAPRKLSFGSLILQAIATSIDALCIGFVFLNLAIPQAMLSFGIIGITTFVLSTAMVFLGKFLGNKIHWFRDYASLVSAVVFVAIGVKILLEGIL